MFFFCNNIVIGGKIAVYGGVDAYLFDKNIRTVYFQVNVYKDTNSPTLRPVFKYVVYWYSDASHKKPLGVKTTTFKVGVSGTHS